MKVIVKELFIDKDDQLKTYQPGEVVDFEASRAKDIIKRGLGVADKSETPVSKAVKKVTKKPSK